MQETVPQSQSMDIQRILSILPHRYPFLLVDRVVECVPGSHIKAYKNVSVNEPFFQGHFPGVPIMPGVLILEALAQTGAVAALSLEENRGKLAIFGGVKNARFKQPVLPGDVLASTVISSPISLSSITWCLLPVSSCFMQVWRWAVSTLRMLKILPKTIRKLYLSVR